MVKDLDRDLDDRTDSIDMSSTDEDQTDGAPSDELASETIVQSVEPLSVAALLETVETFDDVNDDEAFISELMALHPNDADIVVEDLEEAPTVDINLPGILIEQPDQEAEEAVEDVVRQKVWMVFLYRSQLLSFLGRCSPPVIV